jgi:hypothetical protein
MAEMVAAEERRMEEQKKQREAQVQHQAKSEASS